MRTRMLLALAALAPASVVAPFQPAHADTVKVVASIPDFAAVARAVGGDAVEVDAIVRGNRDVHAVELLPSLMMKVRRADVYLKVGMDLDLWAQSLIDGSRNAKLTIVDVSKNITALEVPTAAVNPSMGDIHRFGNPHYWLDPANARPIADAIAEGLAKVAPDRRAQFRAGADAYVARMAEALAGWKSKLAPHKGAHLVSFHNSWPYFARRFEVDVVDFLEPKPGIPPTPAHVAELQARMKKGEVRAILMESYFDDRVPQMLSRTTGVPVVKVPVLVGAAPGTDDPVALFAKIVDDLAAALSTKR